MTAQEGSVKDSYLQAVEKLESKTQEAQDAVDAGRPVDEDTANTMSITVGVVIKLRAGLVRSKAHEGLIVRGDAAATKAQEFLHAHMQFRTRARVEGLLEREE